MKLLTVSYFGPQRGERALEVVVRRWIMEANIDKFKSLLKSETDPAKRAMLIRLLAEEETKLNKLKIAEAKET